MRYWSLLVSVYHFFIEWRCSCVESKCTPSCTGDSTIGPDLCDAVLSALKKHPALGGKVAEVFASLAREGVCVCVCLCLCLCASERSRVYVEL